MQFRSKSRVVLQLLLIHRPVEEILIRTLALQCEPIYFLALLWGSGSTGHYRKE